MAVIKFFTRFEMRCLFRRGCAYLKVSQGYLFSPGIIIFRIKLTELNVGQNRDRHAYLGAGLITLLTQMRRFFGSIGGAYSSKYDVVLR